MVLVKLHTTYVSNEIQFRRIMISFPTLTSSFVNGCRRIIGLDGCHLKEPHRGVFLSAISLDANNEIFAIAYCTCESENLETWSWFLELLSDYLGVENKRVTTFMTKRQKWVIIVQ